MHICLSMQKNQNHLNCMTFQQISLYIGLNNNTFLNKFDIYLWQIKGEFRHVLNLFVKMPCSGMEMVLVLLHAYNILTVFIPSCLFAYFSQVAIQ